MGDSMNLFVRNLDKRVDNALLKFEFEKFGAILSVDVKRDEEGLSKGFGFILFASETDARKALTEMDGTMLLAKRIHVAEANFQEERRCSDHRSMKWMSSFNVTDNRDDISSDDASSVISSVTSVEEQSRDCVKRRMRTLFETQRYADVTFFPKDNRATSISAHRAILSIGSPLFDKMLCGEGSQSNTKLEVQISNLSFTAFKNIVRYLYTDEVFFENDTLAIETLEGAKQFGVESLVDKCTSYFKSVELTEQNVCLYLQISISKNIDFLKEKCTEYIQNNTLQVINSPEFEKYSSGVVYKICKFQSLNLHSEAELLHAVMRWVDSQKSQTKEVIESLRKCIRFLTFSVKEFTEAFKKYPKLLTNDDALKILMYLSGPSAIQDFTSLPSWCNKSTAKRCIYKGNVGLLTGNVSDLSSSPEGKIFIPLKSSTGPQPNLKEMTCVLQMRCKNGHHQISAVKLSFEKPVEGSSMEIFIKVHVSPSNFTAHEVLNVVWSEEIRVPFSRNILARRGDVVDIEVEAKNIKRYEFLQFDEGSNLPPNRHFNCCVISIPKHTRLYFISEVEYGPQVNRDRTQFRGHRRR